MSEMCSVYSPHLNLDSLVNASSDWSLSQDYTIETLEVQCYDYSTSQSI